MQLLTQDLDIGSERLELSASLSQHGLAKAVVLPDQVGRLDLFVVLEYLHQRHHAHVGMGVKTEMPEAAFFVGEHRVDGRVVEEQHPFARLTVIVLVDRVDQRQRVRRRVALQHDLRAIVHR